MNTHSATLAVVIGVAALAVGFAVFRLIDLARAENVRYLPKWAWAILCLGLGLGIPWGGILYLVVGEDRTPKPPSAVRRAPGSG